MPRPVLPAALAVALMLSACGDPVGYPTLAPRAIEQVSLAEPAPGPAPPATAPAAADAWFEPSLDRIARADDSFQRALDEARPIFTAARDARLGSDAWAAAQQRLSRLQALRDPVAAAVSALQDLVAAPETQADPGLAAAGTRALVRARAIDAAEAAALVAAAPPAS